MILFIVDSLCRARNVLDCMYDAMSPRMRGEKGGLVVVVGGVTVPGREKDRVSKG